MSVYINDEYFNDNFLAKLIFMFNLPDTRKLLHRAVKQSISYCSKQVFVFPED